MVILVRSQINMLTRKKHQPIEIKMHHCIIKFKIALPRPPTERIAINNRNPDRIDLNKLKIDLAAKCNTIIDADNQQELYNGCMQAIESTL